MEGQTKIQEGDGEEDKGQSPTEVLDETLGEEKAQHPGEEKRGGFNTIFV